jgi:hypothetical protein
VCLPNPYQIRDIQEKARAARARKRRALRDPASDSHVVLEDDLDELARTQYEALTEAIAQRQVDDDLLAVIEEMSGLDEFEHQAQDAEEFQRLQTVPEEERDAEEYSRLEAQMLSYADKMTAITDKRKAGALQRLRALDRAKVIDMERDFRVKNITDEVFLFTYYTWVIYTCAREPVKSGFPMKRKFAEPAEQHRAAPETVAALREKIRQLENATTKEIRGDAAGNS